MVDPFMEIWKSRRRVDLFLNVLFEKWTKQNGYDFP
jgi:hypothetical protein